MVVDSATISAKRYTLIFYISKYNINEESLQFFVAFLRTYWCMELPRVIPGFFSDWDHTSIESFIDNKYIRNKQYTNKFPWKPNLMMKYINDPFPWWLKLTIIYCNCFDNSLQKLRIKGISILNFHESLSLDYISLYYYLTFQLT